MSKLLTVDDLRTQLRLSRTTAYQPVHQIKHTKIGRRILVAEEDLQEYFKQNSTNPKNNPK